MKWYVLSPAEINSQESLAVTPQTRTVTTPEGMASFLCFPSQGNISSVQWLINGSRLEDHNLRNISHEFVISVHGNFGALVMREVPVEWNNTMVHCTAVFESAATLTSNRCTLLLQGSV